MAKNSKSTHKSAAGSALSRASVGSVHRKATIGNYVVTRPIASKTANVSDIPSPRTVGQALTSATAQILRDQKEFEKGHKRIAILRDKNESVMAEVRELVKSL